MIQNYFNFENFSFVVHFMLDQKGVLFLGHPVDKLKYTDFWISETQPEIPAVGVRQETTWLNNIIFGKHILRHCLLSLLCIEF